MQVSKCASVKVCMCKYASMQICTSIKHKLARMQVCKHASLQVCKWTLDKYASVQICTGVQYKLARMQECKFSNKSMHICKYASEQVCKCAGDGPSPRSREGRIRSGPAEYLPHTIPCWHSQFKIQPHIFGFCLFVAFSLVFSFCLFIGWFTWWFALTCNKSEPAA